MAILGELARILAPEGKMLLVVPFETERRYRRFDAREPNHHLFSWNPQTFGNLLGVAGLHIDSLTWNRYGYDRFAAVGSSRLGLGERGYRVLRASLEILRPLRQIQAVVSLDLKSPRRRKTFPGLVMNPSLDKPADSTIPEGCPDEAGG